MEELRGFKHTGSIKEYVREYSSLMLELPTLDERSRLFYFLDGLQRWAEQELKRRGVETLAQAIAVTESLVEIRRDTRDNARSDSKGKGGGDKRDSNRTPKEDRSEGSRGDKGKGKARDGGDKGKVSCFLCGGPHYV